MSLVEVTIILAVIAMLASVLTPSISGYVDQAKQVRARTDTQTIAEAILDFTADNAERQFLISANGTGGIPPTRSDANRVNLLVSDGDIPTMSAALAETFWTQAVNSGTVDTLANHIVQNTPAATAANRYRNPSDVTTVTPGGTNIDFARAESSGFNAPYAWRGAYLRGPVRADPWGNRYAVNVAFMDPSPTALVANITAGFGFADYPRLDVFVLSAGGDKEIDTRSAQDGAVPGDDDIIFIVSSNAK